MGNGGAKATPLVSPMHVMLGVWSTGQFWEGCISCPLQTRIAVLLLPGVLQTCGLLPFLLAQSDIPLGLSGTCIPPGLQHRKSCSVLKPPGPCAPSDFLGWAQAACHVSACLNADPALGLGGLCGCYGQMTSLVLLSGLRVCAHSPLAGNAVSSALALEFAGEGWERGQRSVSPPSLSLQRNCSNCGNSFCSRCCSFKVPKAVMGATGE